MKQYTLLGSQSIFNFHGAKEYMTCSLLPTATSNCIEEGSEPKQFKFQSMMSLSLF